MASRENRVDPGSSEAQGQRASRTGRLVLRLGEWSLLASIGCHDPAKPDGEWRLEAQPVVVIGKETDTLSTLQMVTTAARHGDDEILVGLPTEVRVFGR